MEQEKTKKINLTLPETTHKKLKLICTIKGIKLNDYVLNLIENEINQTDFNQLIETEL